MKHNSSVLPERTRIIFPPLTSTVTSLKAIQQHNILQESISSYYGNSEVFA